MRNKILQIAIIAWLMGLFPLIMRGADGITNNAAFDESYERVTKVVVKNFEQMANLIYNLPNPEGQAADWKTFRTIKTKLWLDLLNQIDNTRDAKFDFHAPPNLPAMNVAVPGSRYQSGIIPSAIPEPEIRKAYEEAIRINHQKAVRMNFETELRRHAHLYTMTTVNYLQSAYEKTPADAKELADYLNMVTDPAHNAELKAALHDWLKPAASENK